MRSRNGLATIVLAIPILAVALLPSSRADQEQALTYFKAGKYLEAAEEFQALIDEHPDYAYAYFMLGNCFLRTDQVEDAEKSLLKAIELNGDKFEYHYQLANVYARMGENEKIVSTLNSAEALAPNEQYKRALYKLRGFVNYRAEDWEAAAADLAKAGTAAEVVSRLAKAHFKLGNTQAAATAFAYAVQSSPEDAELRRLYAETLLILARKAESDSQKAKIYGDALAQAEKLMRLEPNSFDADNLVGRSALGAKWYDKAVAAFTSALQKKPDRCDAIVNLGKALMAKRDWAKSSWWLDNATRCDPSMAVAWENKAYTLQMQKKFEEAIQNYEKALSINPHSHFAAKNLEFCRQMIRSSDWLLDTLGEAGAQRLLLLAQQGQDVDRALH